jgi:hypothetical protein
MTTSQIFNGAASFYLDPSAVKGAPLIDISSIDIFFNQKPKATGNKSGITNPGVTMYIVKVDANKQPNINPIINGNYTYSVARVVYNDIATSADASRPTNFKFSPTVPIESGQTYAFVFKFDGNEDFILWKDKKGDLLVGSSIKSSGAAGKYYGDFYDSYYYDPTTQIPPVWNVKTDVDLKFKVYAARYAANGLAYTAQTAPSALLGSTGTAYSNTVVTANGAQFTVQTNHYEFAVHNKKNGGGEVIGGERVYQNTVIFPGGGPSGLALTVQTGNSVIVANTLYPNGQPFSWSNVLNFNNDEHIVIVSNNHFGGGTSKSNIRRVLSVISNTAIVVDMPVDFTNASAAFIRSPIARLNYNDVNKHHSQTANGSQNQKLDQDFIILSNSSSNSSIRFVNNYITNVTTSNSGTGYSNSDFIAFFGHESSNDISGGYPAIANILTNNTGAIQAIYFSNVGAGFVNTANVYAIMSNSSTNVAAITNATPNTSLGGNLSFTILSGSHLVSEYYGNGRGGFYANVSLVNPSLNQVFPNVKLNNLTGVQYSMSYKNTYYSKKNANTWHGQSHHSDDNRGSHDVQDGRFTDFDDTNTIVIPSKSNEFTIKSDATGLTSLTPPPGSGILTINAVSNSDFICVKPGGLNLSFTRYHVNNIYTNENTNYGLADAKHVSTKVQFDNNKFAEDIRIFITAYRPLGTDVKMFARIHNSNDSESFDDKDWTLLGLVSGDIYSSSSDQTNYIEMGFGFNQYPNSVFTTGGKASITDVANVAISGSGTTWQSNLTANLQPNDIVKIYSPLFPTNNYWIGVVATVANDSYITLTDPVANSGVVGNGLQIDLIGRAGNSTANNTGYPYQAFNNMPNSNVARYYSTTGIPYDTFNTMQIKIVLLSNTDTTATTQLIPRVDDVQVLGVSA